MVEFNVDFKKEGIESGVAIGRFDEALKELTKNGHKVISLSENACLRANALRRSKISQHGNDVREGNIYHKGEKGIVVANSPYLTNDSMLQEAITANANRMHYSTPNRKLYDKFYKQAQEDASKNPSERRAVLMPSDKEFALSDTQNP